MSETRKRRVVIAACLVVLLAGIWIYLSSRPGETPDAQPAAATPAQPAAESRPKRLLGSEPLRVTRTNPVKAALRNTSWKIVARSEGADAGEDAESEAEGAAVENAAPQGISSTRLSLEFVRANFDAAGMRGVERFAAFSPPQFEAIKKALKKHEQTSISTAPDEFAPVGETVYYDLVNAEDDRQFAIEFTPRPDAGNKTMRLRIATAGSTRRRDTELPIWDGQTVMVPLAYASDGKGRLALFITARILGEDGKPVNEFLVWQ